ncbi:MAG: transglutaminase domain-containing protein [Ruminiclostridium sp.]|nr:transglutaminase domain-containing protein [Ruminiclostridium sp.]
MIDVSTSSDGYFTVDCDSYIGTKMKVGVTYNGKTEYLDYTAGTEASYSFLKGDGTYTVTLYRNLSGTKYRQVTSTRAKVVLTDPLAPYLASTVDVTFSDKDTVGLTAAALCADLETDEEKIVAIYNYVAKNFRYDFSFASKVRGGTITVYIPDTNKALETKRGVCCDFSSVFAAMCRSQGIPCAVATGYQNGSYHAWNMVWVDNEWLAVDMTKAVCRKQSNMTTLSQCVVSLDRYTDYTF